MTLKNRIINMQLNGDQLGIFYLGQVGFILKYQEKYLLVDGYLSDYTDRNCCTELVKWVRRYPAPLLPEELDFVDYVFCTHEHYDHADPYTLSALNKVNEKAVFYAPAPICQAIQSYGIDASKIFPVMTQPEESRVITSGISFHAIPSAHEDLHPDGKGSHYEVGYIFDFNGITVYHSGDCCMYRGLEEKIMNTDILMIPINGRDYYRNAGDIIGCFDSTEALTLAKHTNAKLLIPTHFDLYDVNAVNPAYFVDCQQRIHPYQRYHIFMPGEGYIYSREC